MSTEQTDDKRLEAIQDEIDQIRKRLPDNPGLDIPDPDAQPVLHAEEEAGETGS